MEHIRESINGIAIIDNGRYDGLIIFEEYRIIFRGPQYQCAVAFDWSSAKCSVDEQTVTKLGLIKTKKARYHMYDQYNHYFDFIDSETDYEKSIQWIQELFKVNKKHAIDRNHTAQMQEEQRQEIERLTREREQAEALRITEENRMREAQEAEQARLNQIKEAQIREEMQLQKLEEEKKALKQQDELRRQEEERLAKEREEAERARLNEIRDAKEREEAELQRIEVEKNERERLAKEHEEAEAKRIAEEDRIRAQQDELRRQEEERRQEELRILEERIEELKVMVDDENEHLEKIRKEIAKNEAHIEEKKRIENEKRREIERIEREREEARIAKQREKEAAEKAEIERIEKKKKEEEEHERRIRVAQERELIKKQKEEDALREEDKKKKRELQKKLKNSGQEQQKKLFNQEEEVLKELYLLLKQNVSDAQKKVDEIQRKIDNGNFATGTIFMAFQDLKAAKDVLKRCEENQKNLSNNPYFSHMAALADKKDKEDYFLSDNENLNEYIPLGVNSYILPFKRDKGRPIISAIRRCHMEKNGKSVSYDSEDGSHTITPQLICDTKIYNKKLLEVTQLYPTPEEFHVEADELLADRLEENRNDPKLSNIISTLQLQQFEIIETDVKTSFIVQGCPGSGKSQCLIHRLFFLREELSESGWDKVLMITPTKLFRHFSKELMTRYQLTDVFDCSISELYINLLNTYDKRFRDRQYIFQLTEEYLPDDYLYEIYTEENVKKIEKEIDNAIVKYVSQACTYLNEKMPKSIDIDLINGLIERLTKKISESHEDNKSFADDEGYQEYRKRKAEYDACIKGISSLIEEQSHCQKELEELIEEKEQYMKTFQAAAGLKQERTDAAVHRAKMIQEAFRSYEQAKDSSDRNDEYAELENLIEFARIRENNAKDETIIKYSNEVIRYDRRREELEEQIFTGLKVIEEKSRTIEEFLKWVEGNPYDGQETWSDKEKTRASISQVRYYLSRLESTIFEQEVWNVMAPIKERYEIPTLDIETLEDDKRKENRILYKSDLLFYIMIYMKLYPNAKLPDYRLICIDEGQDLHRADYETLKKLFPKATFNVFGDIGQVLHEACGISDWKGQTGIPTVFPIMTNYRNTAAIVDFCNNEFNVEMEYIGKPENSSKPFVVSELEIAKELLEEEDMVIIVKDRDVYIELCDEMGVIPEDYAFLDTTAEKSNEDDKECYSIYAAKGLEFSNVFVFANNMTTNQKVVACTRAMNKLYYYGG